MNQKFQRTCLVVLLSFVCLFALAQGKQVSGIVKDTSGEPVIGANVIVKGTTNGTITGIDGDFTLSNVKKSDVIVFTFIGYKTEEVKYTGQSSVNVTLKDDTELLDEVVVIGYGTVNKRDLTGSVASVKAEDIAAVPVSSAVEALTGKLAGVNITTTEGSPDAEMKIRVRGGGSLSQDNSPLYIVDGFPVSSISDIAPSEIQSIDVLKDASSTAIYGARSANGVIIITTKSGKEGKVQVDFGASFGVKQVTRLTKVLDPYNYVAYQNEIDMGKHGNYSDMDIWRSVDGFDYQDEMFGRTGNQQQYNINVSGGSKELQYSVSYAHNEEKSIMLNSGFKKDNINAKIKSELNKWLSLDFNARLSHTAVEGLGGGADTNESNAANSTVANSVIFRPIDLCKPVRMTRRTLRQLRRLRWSVYLPQRRSAVLLIRIIMSVSIGNRLRVGRSVRSSAMVGNMMIRSNTGEWMPFLTQNTEITVNRRLICCVRRPIAGVMPIR